MDIPIAKTHEAAVEQIRRMASDEIAFCPVPCRGDFSLYASKAGEIFQIWDTECGSIYRRKPVFNNAVSFSTTGKRAKTSASVANMVYSAFVAREFRPVRRFEYKDGNPNNCALSNLVLKGERDYTKVAHNMDKLQDLLMAHKDKFIKNVQWHYFVSEADAEDIVSEAFILLCGKGLKKVNDAYFCGAMYKSIMAVYQIWRNKVRSRFCKPDDLDGFGTWDDDFSEAMPFCMRRLQSENTRYSLYLWSLGYTRDEICEMLGQKRTTIDGRIGEALKACRKSLKNDIEIYYAL